MIQAAVLRLSARDARVRLTVVVLSLGFHAVVLGPILISQLGRDEDTTIWCPFPFPMPSPPMQVTLERPLRPGPLAHVRRPPPRDIAFQSSPVLPGNEDGVLGGPFRSGVERTSESSSARTGSAPPEAGAGPDARWRVEPGTPSDRIARSLRDGVVGCRSPEMLNSADRIACEDRFAQTASRAASLEGTGDLERDARQARQGAFQLAEYERRRAPLTPHSRARGCPGGEIKGTCPIMIPLWSSGGGFLPTLRPGRDE